MAQSVLLKSSLAKKYWMALTGLFLCLFLVGHLAGNLQLFIGGIEGQLQFNEYAKFMTSNPLVKILSYVTYISIVFHAIDGLLLTVKNKNARPVKYHNEKPSANSAWASRNMGILGTILLVFIITHMMNFWYEMHWGEIGVDANGNKDLHTIVIAFFKDASMGLLFTLAYVLSMLAVAFHLSHGFQSAFQSLGLRHEKYTPIIQKIGFAFALLVPLAFAAIPLYIHFVY